MRFARRPLLSLSALAPLGLAFAGPGAGTARAQTGDPRLEERSTGRADAPVRVIEFFSLTCGHCAAFHRTVWPQVKEELVEKGLVRMVWRDFPLDQVGLTAAMVARSLPAERYEPFLSVLFATQQSWAFASDPTVELGKLAMLAGMPRERFDAVRADMAFGRAVMETRMSGQAEYKVEATPTFVFGRRTHSGNLPYERFRSLVEEAARA